VEGLDDGFFDEKLENQDSICPSPVVGYTPMLHAVALRRVEVIKGSIMQNSYCIVKPSRSHSIFTKRRHFSAYFLLFSASNSFSAC
jgi:hypothetical protein